MVVSKRKRENNLFAKALYVDKLFTKMREEGLQKAKARCPACKQRGVLYLEYNSPRSARAVCTDDECDFSLMA